MRPEAAERAALLAALRLQLDWGADEALADSPLDRGAARPSPPAGEPAALPAGRPAAARQAAPAPALVLPGRAGGPVAAPPAAARAAAELAAAAGTLEALRAAMARFEGSP